MSNTLPEAVEAMLAVSEFASRLMEDGSLGGKVLFWVEETLGDRRSFSGLLMHAGRSSMALDHPWDGSTWSEGNEMGDALGRGGSWSDSSCVCGSLTSVSTCSAAWPESQESMGPGVRKEVGLPLSWRIPQLIARSLGSQTSGREYARDSVFITGPSNAKLGSNVRVQVACDIAGEICGSCAIYLPLNPWIGNMEVCGAVVHAERFMFEKQMSTLNGSL